MKNTKKFNSRLEAIEWLACNALNEGQFEVLREELNFNFIYTNEYFITIDKQLKEVVLIQNLSDGKNDRPFA